MTRALILAVALCACDDGESSAMDAAPIEADGQVGAVDAGDPDAGTVPDGAPLDAASAADVAGDSAADGAPPLPDAGAAPLVGCTADTRVGTFRVLLEDAFTGIQGQVADAVNPRTVPTTTAESGACRLLQPPTLFCEPGCGAGETCDGERCVPLPTNVDVGTVEIAGLKAPVSMTASAPVWFYTNRDPLEHPGFDAGADIRLSASGADPVAGFALRGWGITALTVTTEAFVLESGTPAVLEWTTPDDVGPARVHLDLNIANHGGTPARIECDVDDSGRFEVPPTLVEQLLGLGFSGFPTITATRLSVDSADTAVGCVELRVQSAVVLDVTIPGLTSCSGDEDCPEGEFCQGDLTCGGGE